MGKYMHQEMIIDRDLEEALEIIKEVYKEAGGPWGDALIDETLYNSIESLIEKNK